MGDGRVIVEGADKCGQHRRYEMRDSHTLLAEEALQRLRIAMGIGRCHVQARQ